MLEIILVVIFFLDDFKIVLVKLLILILCLSLILGELVIFLDSLIRFVVLLNQELRKADNCLLVQKAGILTNLVNDFLGRLNLAN